MDNFGAVSVMKKHTAKKAGGSERARFDRRLFPVVPSAMHTAWVAEKATLPTTVPAFKTQYKTYTGKDAAQALLGKACYEGDMDAVKRAVAAGADPNRRAYWDLSGTMGGDYTAVAVAAWNGNVSELRFLLAVAGADPNIDTDSSLGQSSSGMATLCFAACVSHHHDCMRVLLAMGATPDHSTRTNSRKCTCPADIAR